MPRYIDAYKAKNEIRRRRAEADIRGERFLLGIVEAALDNVESADVEEVRHGEWIEKVWNVVCSSCGVGKWKGYVPGLQEAKEWMPRCPNCGAKMDGKKEE